jgi:cell division septation protein DedD
MRKIMNNERGGIISKIVLIPVALALMAGFFFLGYFVGKYQSKSGTLADAMPPMPEIISKNLPKQDEFTFYKTLTDKYDKTVSIDLKPKSSEEVKHVDKKPAADETAPVKGAQQPQNDRKMEGSADRDKPAEAGQSAPKQQVSAKKEIPAAQKLNSRLRYTLQIASYPEKGMAEDDIKKMKQRGYAAFIVASDLPGKGTWYRVRLGSFSNKASAEKLQKELRAKEGISPFITIE